MSGTPQPYNTRMSQSQLIAAIAKDMAALYAAQPAPVTPVPGFGTPTGAGVVANFSGTAATTAQMQATIAQILTILKANGFIGA